MCLGVSGARCIDSFFFPKSQVMRCIPIKLTVLLPLSPHSYRVFENLIVITTFFFFLLAPPPISSTLPPPTPAQALECYKCSLGIGSLCITTKTTCKNGELCFSGVGEAGEELRCQKCHGATFCEQKVVIKPKHLLNRSSGWIL